jgi:hypothetical protein
MSSALPRAVDGGPPRLTTLADRFFAVYSSLLRRLVRW